MKTKLKKNINKKEIIYIDILRIIACFCVIINHTQGFLLEKGGFGNTLFYCLTFSFCKVGVVLFLMISGMLILDKDYDFKKILKCIYRVLVPVLGLSFIFYILNVGFSSFSVFEFIKSILYEPYLIAYWYIYALIGIYFTIPFLQKMVKSFKIKDYVIFVILFLLVPTFWNTFGRYFSFFVNSNFLAAFFPVLLSVVVCGSFLSKINLEKKYLITAIVTLFISYLVMMLFMFVPYIKGNGISYAFDSWSSFPVILMSMSFFYIIRYIYENKKFSEKTNKVISGVASTTFGIYLIHLVLNHRLYNFGLMQRIFSFNGILAIVILDILVFVVSMFVIMILKKVPIIKKFL